MLHCHSNLTSLNTTILSRATTHTRQIPTGCSSPNFLVVSNWHRQLSCLRSPTPITSGTRSCRWSCFAYKNFSRSGKGMNWYHEITLDVREYELDGYGVVNNAVYANYCEYGEHQLSDLIGFDGYTAAASELSLKFFAPLRRRDKFVLKVRVYDFSTTRFFFEDLIFKLPNLEPILEAKTTVVWLDKKYRPARIPSEMIAKYTQFLACHEIGSN